MPYYKVIIQEKSSFTAYLKADNQTHLVEKAIQEDITSYDNQDFEQEVIKIIELKKKNIPDYRTINE